MDLLTRIEVSLELLNDGGPIRVDFAKLREILEDSREALRLIRQIEQALRHGYAVQPGSFLHDEVRQVWSYKRRGVCVFPKPQKEGKDDDQKRAPAIDGAAFEIERLRKRVAELEARGVSAVMGEILPAVAWQTIDTAPKDGTKILLAKIVGHSDHDTALWWAVLGFWSDRWQNWNDGFEPCGLAGPTHWAPISARGIGYVLQQAQAPLPESGG